MKKELEMDAIEISKENIGEVILLPCVEMVFKTVSGNFRVKGTFTCKRHYAQEKDWLVLLNGTWRAMSSDEYERIKIKLNNLK